MFGQVTRDNFKIGDKGFVSPDKKCKKLIKPNDREFQGKRIKVREGEKVRGDNRSAETKNLNAEWAILNLSTGSSQPETQNLGVTQIQGQIRIVSQNQLTTSRENRLTHT